MIIRKKHRYKSDAFEAIHDMMEGFHSIGAISDTTMRKFDASCLEPVAPLKPAQIRALRKRERVSQPVFAYYLNVSKNLISDWERGIKKPGGPALRLLSIIQKHGIALMA